MISQRASDACGRRGLDDTKRYERTGDDAAAIGGLNHDAGDSSGRSNRQQDGAGFPDMMEGVAFQEGLGVHDMKGSQHQIGQRGRDH